MAISLFYTIQDGNGETSTTSIPFPAGTGLTDIGPLVLAVGNLIQPLTTGGLLNAGVTVEFDISGAWGPTANFIADVQEKAEFMWRTVTGWPKRLNIPAFDQDKFNVGADTVDLTDPDVVAFNTMMEDGITVNATLYQPSDARNSDLESIGYARKNWSRRRS